MDIQGVTTYHIGEGNKFLMMVEDIFGIDSGRHRVIADYFASKGYNVFMPELLNPFYDGPLDMGAIVANIKGQDYEKMEINFSKVLGHIKSKGCEKMHCIGFCWGVWYSFKMSAKFDCFKAIACPHPSLGAEGIFGGTAAAVAQKVKCPALFLPANNDPDDVKEKGEVV